MHLLTVFLVFVSSMFSAQQDQKPQGPPTVGLPYEGAMIVARLTRKLDVGKVKVGDSVPLELVTELKDASGKAVLGKGAKLTGQVTEATAHGGSNPASRLAFRVTGAEWNGQKVPLDAVPWALAARQQQAQMAGSDTKGGAGPEASAYFTKDIEGLAVERDPQLGTVITSKSRNVILPSDMMIALKTLGPK